MLVDRAWLVLDNWCLMNSSNYVWSVELNLSNYDWCVKIKWVEGANSTKCHRFSELVLDDQYE